MEIRTNIMTPHGVTVRFSYDIQLEPIWSLRDVLRGYFRSLVNSRNPNLRVIIRESVDFDHRDFPRILGFARFIPAPGGSAFRGTIVLGTTRNRYRRRQQMCRFDEQSRDSLRTMGWERKKHGCFWTNHVPIPARPGSVAVAEIVDEFSAVVNVMSLYEHCDGRTVELWDVSDARDGFFGGRFTLPYRTTVEVDEMFESMFGFEHGSG